MKLRITVLILFSLQINLTFSQIRDPRPKDQANVFWNGNYPLYSLVTDQEILPNSSGEYIFWGTTNEDPKPISYKMKKGQTLYVYKFFSYEECVLFCNPIRSSKNMTLINSKNQTASIIPITEKQNINYFTEFVRKEDIGKNQITNPYNTGDKSIINQVDYTVRSIDRKISLINYDLNTIRKSLPNSEEKLKQLYSNCIRTSSYYNSKTKKSFNFYMVMDRENMIKKLKKYHMIYRYGNLPNYRIFLSEILHENSSDYFGAGIESSNNYWEGGEKISKEDWNKLVKKEYILKVEEDKEDEFIFENCGASERQCIDLGLFRNLEQDLIKNSVYKQDIFGYTYIGQVENGVRSGFGTLVNLFQDTIYKGIWKDDMPYQGQFYQFNYENKCFGNCENGIGLMVVHTNCVYRGGFKDRKWEGKGEYIFKPTYNNSNNNYMTSTYTNGKEGADRKDFTLNAIKTENNNLVINKFYNGDIFFYSKKEDEDGYHKVVRLFNNGQIFSGYVADNDNKRGTSYFPNGDIYIGSTIYIGGNDEKSGIWTKLNSNGTCDIYTGQFINSQLNGIGSVIYANGQIKEGLFENGKFIKSNVQIEEEKIAEGKQKSQEIELTNKETKQKENDLFQNDFDPSKVKWNYVKNTTKECSGCPKIIQCSKKTKDDLAFETNLNSIWVLPSAKLQYSLGKSFGIPNPYLLAVNLYECAEFCSNECKYYYNLNKERGY